MVLSLGLAWGVGAPGRAAAKEADAVPPVSPALSTAAADAGNLALGARVFVSSVYNNEDAYNGEKLTDGGLGHFSRWASAAADGQWVILELPRVTAADELRVYEDTTHGKRIQGYCLEYWDGEDWVKAADGSMQGEDLEPVDADKNLTARRFTTEFAAVTAQRFRLSIERASDGPALREIQLFNRAGQDPVPRLILVDGKALEGFDPDRPSYTVLVQGDRPPQVTSEGNGVRQAEGLPGRAVVSAEAGKLRNDYTISFVKDEGRSMNEIINAEAYSAQSGVSQSRLAPDGAGAGGFQKGGWLQYAGMAFDGKASTFMAFASNGGEDSVELELRIDGPDGKRIGLLTIQPTGGADIFVEQYAAAEGVEGTHDLYLVAPQAADCILDTVVLSSYNGSDTPAQREARMQWWREARFGQFIHFGAYANFPFAGDFTGYGEWVMWNQRISRTDYEEKAVKTFNPDRFDAKAIVDLAVAAGQKYIVFTSKHHEGFSMFHTGVKGFSPYNLLDYGVYGGEDPVMALSQAAKEAGIGFGVYYSIMDWKHPGQGNWGNDMLDKARYVSDMKAQLRELVQVYGVDQLWFDGEWHDWWTKEDGQALYKYLRTLNPDLIVNNRVGKRGADEGDFGTPEQEIPAGGLDYDWESCITMNDSWGYVSHDTNWKSAEWIIDSFVSTASRGGNMLLNVGPDPTGRVPADCAAIMEEAGVWLKAHGESLYGTTASPYQEALSFGAATKREGKLYLHVQNWPEGGHIVLPALQNKVLGASLMHTGAALSYNANEQVVVIELPEQPADPYDTVVVLEVEGVPVQSDKAYVQENLALGMAASASDVYFDNPAYGPDKAADGVRSYKDNDDRNEDGTPKTKESRWATGDQTRSAWLQVDFDRPTTFNKVKIDECVSWGARIQNYKIEYWDQGQWKTAFTGKGAGENKVVAFPAVTGEKVRLNILDCLPDVTGGPSVWDLGVYMDGTLSDLRVDGATLPGFSPAVFEYALERPAGSRPQLTATPAYLANTCEIVQAAVPGTATVTVTTLEGQQVVYTVRFTAGGPAAVPGDMDGSGEVTIQDVMEACKVLARQSAGKAPTEEEMLRGDLDGDKRFTISDVMEICKILARKA